MSEQKIFAGPRVRRIRNAAGLTQTAMAAELGISPSYLNLIERNQRPLTVQLLLKLASVYKIDLEELQSGGDSLLPQLKEMFADPLLAGELPGDQELVEVSDAAPNVATAMLKLYRAYREGQDRLTDLSDLLAREGHETRLSGARLPVDEVRDAFEKSAEPLRRPGGGGGGLRQAAGARRRPARRAQDMAARGTRHRGQGSAGGDDAAMAPPLRPPLQPSVHFRTPVVARPAARSRDRGRACCACASPSMPRSPA
jgi:transcriptional regulator with XRE-family HTH domain